MEQLDPAPRRLVASALGADLDDAACAACGFDEQTAFADIVGARLLDVDMFSGRQSEQGGGGVPMIGRRDHHGVHSPVLEHPPHVGHRPGRTAAQLFAFGRGGAATVLIRIAYISHRGIRVACEGAQMVHAHPSRADEAEDDLAAGAGCAEGRCGKGHCSRRRGGAFKELSAAGLKGETGESIGHG